MNGKNKGITLIALIITVIILLILAGVTISSITGKDGMLAKMSNAKNEHNYSAALEKINMKIMEYSISSYTDGLGSLTLKGLAQYFGDSKETEIILKEYNKLAYTQLDKIPAELNNIVVQAVGYEEYQFLIGKECTVAKASLDNGETFKDITTLNNNGNNSNNNIQFEIPQPLASHVEVGDYVAYNALAYDDEGNPYSYVSPVGSGPQHGNGYKIQTHTTKSDIKWRVLSKNPSTGEVALISEKPIMRDENGYPFYIAGAIAYLYAEEELNRICSVYGHGYGANINKVFTCKTGYDVEGLDTVTLTGSGARSINVEDINDIITEFDRTDNSIGKDSLVVNGNGYYGETKTHNLGYPTKTTGTGISASTLTRTETDNSFSFFPQYYLNEDSTLYTMLFGDVNDTSYTFGYWLASRGVSFGYNGIVDWIDFEVGCIKWNNLKPEKRAWVKLGDPVCGWENEVYGRSGAGQHGVRPIVYLKETLKTTGQNNDGAWTIIDEK